jgi:hypothetical protein
MTCLLGQKTNSMGVLESFFVLETPMHLEDSRAGKRATFIYLKKPQC